MFHARVSLSASTREGISESKCSNALRKSAILRENVDVPPISIEMHRVSFAARAGVGREEFLLFRRGNGGGFCFCYLLPGQGTGICLLTVLAFLGSLWRVQQQKGLNSKEKKKRLPYSVVGRCRDSWAVPGYSSTVGILCGRALQG